MFIRNLNYPLRKISYFRMIFDIGEREREEKNDDYRKDSKY